MLLKIFLNKLFSVVTATNKIAFTSITLDLWQTPLETNISKLGQIKSKTICVDGDYYRYKEKYIFFVFLGELTL